MHHLGLLATLLLLFTNLWGGALVAGLIWRHRWFAFSVAPLLWTTVWFGVESVVGLGPLRWLLALTTLVSVFVWRLSAVSWEPTGWSPESLARLRAWRAEFAPRKAIACWTVFGLIFGYALLWRWAFPDIDGSSEKLSDLSYLASYMAGDKIPVIDAWLHPYPSIHYYSFQHYAAAHLGRMFGWSVGLTYNLSFCLLVGLAGAAFAGAVTLITSKRWIQIGTVACFILGGSGASGIVHWVYEDPAVWNGNRFIGSSKVYDVAPLGTFLREHAARFDRIELPGEPFAYTIFLGDYHPPMAGFYLLGITAMAVLLWQRTPNRRNACVLGAAQSWIVLGNTWVFPLQAGLVFVWWLWQSGQRQRLLLGMVAGALTVWFCAYGFLHPFLLAAQEYKTALRWVPAAWHTPPLLFVLYLLPTLTVLIGALYSGRREGIWAGLVGLGFLGFTEFFYLDDVYAGEFERFNSSLKWWPWLSAATLLLGAWLLDRATRPLLRGVVAVLMLYPLAFGVDLARHWWSAPKFSAGQLEGQAYLRRTDASRITLLRLGQEPRGVVGERPNKDSYTNSACLPLFAGHRMWLGWVGHEALWRGYSNDIWQRQDNLVRLYSGDFPQAGAWGRAQGIDYFLWYQDTDTNEIWERLYPEMDTDYLWKEIFVTPDGRRVGYWVLRGGRSSP